SITGSLVIAPKRRASVDFPDAPRPRMTTRCMLQGCSGAIDDSTIPGRGFPPCLFIARCTSERIHPPERPVAARRRLGIVALRLQHRVTLKWECRGASPGAVRRIESRVKD